MTYFDHNAATPLTDVAREAWLKAHADHWQNPASTTRAAARARLRLESYHEALAVLLGGEAGHYVFTSGATEGAHAVLGRWASRLAPDARIAIAATEHACVQAAAARHFSGRTMTLAHDDAGIVSAETVRASLCAGAAGVIVMAANNETGVLQPWVEIAEVCRAANALLLCDATQWLGKLPGAGLGACGAWLIASGHKFGAPKGTGFIKLPSADPDFAIFPGRPGDARPGTADVAGASALCAALVEAERHRVLWEWRHAGWRDAFEASLLQALPGTRVLAAGADRLWNTSLIVAPHGENTRWVARLDKRDVQVSTGAACSTGKDTPSHVAAALGVEPAAARRVLRFSASWATTESDWATLTTALREVGAELASGV